MRAFYFILTKEYPINKKLFYPEDILESMDKDNYYHWMKKDNEMICIKIKLTDFKVIEIKYTSPKITDNPEWAREMAKVALWSLNRLRLLTYPIQQILESKL